MSTGEACKMKVRRRFRPLGSLTAALKYYELPPPGFQNSSTQTEQISNDKGVNTDESMNYSLELLQKCFQQLPGQEQTKLQDSFFSITCKSRGVAVVPHGFIEYSICSMQHLQQKGKSNVVASAAYVFGNMRPDRSDSRFPTDRMPFGLIDYCFNYFRADSLNEVDHIIIYTCMLSILL